MAQGMHRGAQGGTGKSAQGTGRNPRNRGHSVEQFPAGVPPTVGATPAGNCGDDEAAGELLSIRSSWSSLQSTRSLMIFPWSSTLFRRHPSCTIYSPSSPPASLRPRSGYGGVVTTPSSVRGRCCAVRGSHNSESGSVHVSHFGIWKVSCST